MEQSVLQAAMHGSFLMGAFSGLAVAFAFIVGYWQYLVIKHNLKGIREKRQQNGKPEPEPENETEPP